MNDLAKRAVACRKWDWAAGMRVRAFDSSESTILPDGFERQPQWTRFKHGFVPALDDAGTLGHVLALVRRAWNAPFAQVSPAFGRNMDAPEEWVVYLNDEWRCHPMARGESEAAALVAALEKAP